MTLKYKKSCSIEEKYFLLKKFLRMFICKKLRKKSLNSDNKITILHHIDKWNVFSYITRKLKGAGCSSSEADDIICIEITAFLVVMKSIY